MHRKKSSRHFAKRSMIADSANTVLVVRWILRASAMSVLAELARLFGWKCLEVFIYCYQYYLKTLIRCAGLPIFFIKKWQYLVLKVFNYFMFSNFMLSNFMLSIGRSKAWNSVRTENQAQGRLICVKINYDALGGCHSSTRLPSGSITQPNLP